MGGCCIVPDFLRETKSWLYLAAVIALLILATVVVSRCTQSHDQSQRTEKATSKALDTVATQTPVIRQEQEDKQREVDNIEGSDQRLPDGYGRDLQQLRDKRNPR